MTTDGLVLTESMLYSLLFISSLNYSIHYSCSEHEISEIELEQSICLRITTFNLIVSPRRPSRPRGVAEKPVPAPRLPPVATQLAALPTFPLLTLSPIHPLLSLQTPRYSPVLPTPFA